MAPGFDSVSRVLILRVDYFYLLVREERIAALASEASKYVDVKSGIWKYLHCYAHMESELSGNGLVMYFLPGDTWFSA